MAVANEEAAASKPNANQDESENTSKPKELTELDKYWKAVNDNPSDFTGWTYLLQYVEQEDNIDAARKAFDSFLQRYPYCYGYWKKYADLEKKKGDMDKAQQVFEQGVKAIPLSIELWSHYINFTTARHAEDPNITEILSGVYDRALAAAGTDFRSDKLWEMYINWHKEAKRLTQVTALYDRVLRIPTQLYKHQFEKFSEHVNENNPKDILSLDEFLDLRKQILASKKESSPDAAAETETKDEEGPPGDAPPGTDDAPPGEEAPPGMDAVVTVEPEEEIIALREKIIELRQITHFANEEEVSKRWSYEEGIRRPYFHVKPLERAQMKNWREYLEFEIEFGIHERIMVLFERCLVACALYEEFWLKYAKYMESHSVDGARQIFRRACKVHLPKKPSLHLAWAAFEERQGHSDHACEVLQNLEESVPGLATISVRRIGLQRRQANFPKVEELYKVYMEKCEKAEEKSFYAIKYARYIAKLLGDHKKAKEILMEALQNDGKNHKIFLQLIDLEYQKSQMNEFEMISLFDKAITSELAIEHRVAFSQRKLEFMEDFSSNINRVLETYEEHQKLIKELQSTKKRKADDTKENDSKKAKTTATTTSSNNNSNGVSNSTPADTSSTTPATTAAPAATGHDQHYQYGHYSHWPGYGSQNYYHHGGWGQHYDNRSYYGQ